MLFTVDSEAFETAFWDEIWGCVNYIHIPYDTLMNMPIQDRKIWIQKHNMEVERRNGESSKGSSNGNSSISGEMLNGFAELEQM